MFYLDPLYQLILVSIHNKTPASPLQIRVSVSNLSNNVSVGSELIHNTLDTLGKLGYIQRKVAGTQCTVVRYTLTDTGHDVLNASIKITAKILWSLRNQEYEYFPKCGMCGKMIVTSRRDTIWCSEKCRVKHRAKLAKQKIPDIPKSGVRGIYFHRASGLWMINIMLDGKRKYIGARKDLSVAIEYRKYVLGESDMLKTVPRYVIKDGTITCNVCHVTSNNGYDVQNKYCPTCRQPHKSETMQIQVGEKCQEQV